MYYKHTPGWVSRLLSAPILFSLAKALYLAGNQVLGPSGNKVAIRARRRRES
jgi:hypothetical protein